MTLKNPNFGRLNRRQLMKAAGITAAGGGSALSTLLASRRGVAQTPDRDPSFLIVIAAAGGASIIDSFLAIRESEAGQNAPGINCFRDNEVVSVAGTELRGVNLSRNQVGAIPIPFQSNQSRFVEAHKDDIMVVTQTGTSVNHNVAQKRSITGNDAWNGRTLMEAVAAEYGAGMAVPNVNMSGSGYLEPGVDASLPGWARAEPVASPALWPLSLDGSRGIKNLPSKARLERARALRDGTLDTESVFGQTFANSERLNTWRQQREQGKVLEELDLITKLNLYPDLPEIPLIEYGLDESPDGAAVRAAFPDFQTDPLEAQAALSFLLVKNRVATTVTISPSFQVLLDLQRFKVTNPPLAFDFSHQSHRDAQAVMWDRMLSVADRLIGLLKGQELTPGTGTSMWDRSMIYIATEFGRTKTRPNNSQSFGTSHNLNNGFAVISPLVNGNRVLGGVDPATGLTYGFDPMTGAPEPGREMEEAEIYSGLVNALGVDTTGSGLPPVPAMKRNG